MFRKYDSITEPSPDFFRSNKGGIYLYDYLKAYNQDRKIKKAVNEVLRQLKTCASLFKNRNDEWFTISTSLTFVNTISMNWMLALGGHYFGIVADVMYTTVLNVYIMEYWVIAIDRYNFDGNNKSFFGIKDSYNGRFVELGWAKFFTSIGIMRGITTWKK